MRQGSFCSLGQSCTSSFFPQLYNAAVIGIAASLALAFLILILLTRDLQLAVMAIFSIGGVVVSLICAIVWLGWDLSGESMERFSLHVADSLAWSQLTSHFFTFLSLSLFLSPLPPTPLGRLFFDALQW